MGNACCNYENLFGKSTDELDLEKPKLDIMSEHQDAAVQIQSIWRGRQARKALKYATPHEDPKMDNWTISIDDKGNEIKYKGEFKDGKKHG